MKRYSRACHKAFATPEAAAAFLESENQIRLQLEGTCTVLDDSRLSEVSTYLEGSGGEDLALNAKMQTLALAANSVAL